MSPVFDTLHCHLPGAEFILNHFKGNSFVHLVLAILPLVLAYKIAFALFFSPLRNIPGPFLARVSGIFTLIPSIVSGLGDYTRSGYKRYGDIYVIRPNAIVITNPSDIKTVLTSSAFTKTDFYKAFELLDTPNILSTSSIELSRQRRRTYGALFNPCYLSRAESKIMAHGILALKGKWDRKLAGSPSGELQINFCNEFGLATLDTICALSFGAEVGDVVLDGQGLQKWILTSVRLLGVYSALPILKRFPFSLAVRPMAEQFDCLCAFLQSTASNRQKRLQAGGSKPDDLLQAFIDSQDPGAPYPMSDSQFLSDAFIIIAGGSDTLTCALVWAVHLLMLNPESYARATGEVRGKFSANHIITYAAAKKQLPFVEACILESLRLRPTIGGILPRVSPTSGLTLSGHYIPPGTEIEINFGSVGIHKETWPEPLKYDPTRFVDNECARNNVFGSSFGPRMCMGKNLAWMEMLTIIANMLKDYDWSFPADITHLGPHVLDQDGNPKMLDIARHYVAWPARPDQDCRLILTRHQ